MKLNKLDNLIKETISEWDIPGAAIGIIKENETIFAETYGKRDRENGCSVTPETLFRTGSCTKPFTATAISMLVENGKLKWDTPIHNYLPEFKMSSTCATKQISVRDILCHRTGLPGHDLLWFFNNFNSRKELMTKIKHLELNKGIRTTYQYNNIVYAVLGYIIEYITGNSWEKYIKEEILTPLQMNNTNCSVSEMKEVEDSSEPYTKDENDKIIQIPFYSHEIIGGPCGGINSSLEDMLQWLEFNINKGSVGNRKLINEETITTLFDPIIKTPLTRSQYNELFASFYGMGWGIRNYRGEKRICHYGGIDGFSAYTGLIPEENTGIVIMTNTDDRAATYFIDIVNYRLMDYLFDLDPIDWNQRFKNEITQKNNKDISQKQNDSHSNQTNPTHPLVDFTGTYRHPGYGEFKIEKRDNKLKLTTDRENFILKHLDYNIFQFTIKKWGMNIPIKFNMDLRGRIFSFTTRLDPRVNDITFKKINDY